GRVLTVPAAVFADEHAVGVGRPHHRIREGQAERGDVCTERVVRGNGRGDLVRILRTDALVDVLAPVAVRPAVEAAFAHRGQVVRHQILAQLVAFVDHRPQLAAAGLDGQCGGGAQPGGVGAVGAGGGVDFPDHGAVDFRVHAAFGDVAV